MPSVANAQYVQLYCGNNGAVGGGQIYYADQANQKGACQNQGIQHIFSQIVCNFVIILNNVLSQVYCGIQYVLTPTLAILLTLYVIIFGGQILVGTAQLNSKEIMVRLIKIAGVWTFATQSTWGINILFQFFFGAAAEGSMWVVNSINPSLTATNPTPDSTNFGNFMVMYQFLDGLIYSAMTGPFTQANNKVVGFFIVLMFFFPALFTMACTWLLTTFSMLVRTLIDFLLCLSAIAFLMSLTFIFLSFMLFQATNHLFEEWLKYLISYTLQILIVFAIIALWVATMNLFWGFFNELSDLISPYNHVDVANVFSPDNTYGICQYILSDSPPGQPGQPCVAGLPCLPSLKCDATSSNVFSMSQLEHKEDFVYFMAYNLSVLIIIAHAFSVLIKSAPGIARQLSGPSTVPPLGGGFGMKGFGQASGGRSPRVRVANAGEDREPRTRPPGSGNAVREFLGSAASMVMGRGGIAPLGVPAGVNLGANIPALNPNAATAWNNRPSSASQNFAETAGADIASRTTTATDALGDTTETSYGAFANPDSTKTTERTGTPVAFASDTKAGEGTAWSTTGLDTGAATAWNFDAAGNAAPVGAAEGTAWKTLDIFGDAYSGKADLIGKDSSLIFDPNEDTMWTSVDAFKGADAGFQDADAGFRSADVTRPWLPTGNDAFKAADAGFSSADATKPPAAGGTPAAFTSEGSDISKGPQDIAWALAPLNPDAIADGRMYEIRSG